jgi:FkbM family methyltransferase
MCEISEPWMFDLLSRLLPSKQGTFLDVGVNLGQTLLAVKACEPDRRYVGVEPNPQCVAYAERLIELNHLRGCEIVPVGLASATGLSRLQFYDGTTCDSSASIVDNFRPDSSISLMKIVPVFPFGALEEAISLSVLGIVKIDVEGGEADILTSMCEALRRDRPWLVVEILPCYREDNVMRISRQQVIETVLADIDYVNLRILRCPDGHLNRLKPIESIGIHGKMDWCDYLLCPRADMNKVAELVPIEN